MNFWPFQSHYFFVLKSEQAKTRTRNYFYLVVTDMRHPLKLLWTRYVSSSLCTVRMHAWVLFHSIIDFSALRPRIQKWRRLFSVKFSTHVGWTSAFFANVYVDLINRFFRFFRLFDLGTFKLCKLKKWMFIHHLRILLYMLALRQYTTVSKKYDSDHFSRFFQNQGDHGFFWNFLDK